MPGEQEILVSSGITTAVQSSSVHRSFSFALFSLGNNNLPHHQQDELERYAIIVCNVLNFFIIILLLKLVALLIVLTSIFLRQCLILHRQFSKSTVYRCFGKSLTIFTPLSFCCSKMLSFLERIQQGY